MKGGEVKGNTNMREKNINGPSPVCTPTWDGIHNLVMCSNQDLNQQTLQPIETPGQEKKKTYVIWKHLFVKEINESEFFRIQMVY